MSTKFCNCLVVDYPPNWNTGLYVKVRQNLINYLSQWFAWETSSLFGKTEQVGLISPKFANRKKVLRYPVRAKNVAYFSTNYFIWRSKYSY